MSGKIISGPAAVLLIAFFFLPWIMVSCQGTELGELSGYQLATGVPSESMQDLITPEEMQSEPILFAVPLAGVVALILLAITLWQPDFEQNAAWGQIIAAAATILILLMEWLQLRQNSDTAVDITIQPALWGSLIALLALAGGAILDLVLRQRTRSPVRAAPPATPPKQSFPSQPTMMSPPSAPETAVPDQPYAPDAYGSSQETIVDDDFSMDSGMGQETIVDDNFGDIPQEGEATFVEFVETEVLHFQPDAAKLIIDEGNDKGKQFSLHGNATIGRVSDNDIFIDDTAMSSYHARISEENGRFTIHDLNSTNGVYILKVEETRWEKQNSHELSDGDKIKLGRTTLLFTV